MTDPTSDPRTPCASPLPRGVPAYPAIVIVVIVLSAGVLLEAVTHDPGVTAALLSAAAAAAQRLIRAALPCRTSAA